MLFTVTNNGTARQVFNGSDGRVVSVPPGESLEVNISEKTASRLQRAGRFKIVPIGVYPAGQLKTAPINLPEPQVETQVETATERAADLINRYQAHRINFGRFQEEAKQLLGDKWPGGVPRKVVILELLREL